jgi:hypothetical protein
MTTRQGEQEQPARRVVDDDGRVVHVEEFEAFELQSSQRAWRSVGSRRKRPGVRAQRKVNRDAPVPIPEHAHDIAPQISIRQRAGEEHQRRSLPARSPAQRPEPGF